MDTRDRVIENKLRGYCCSESIMSMALEDMGREPGAYECLVKAMGAYCGGLHEGLACGALCAAKAALFLAEDDYPTKKEQLGPELMRWFKDRFGNWDCAALLEGDMERKQTMCPGLIAETYNKLYDMLEDIGAI